MAKTTTTQVICAGESAWSSSSDLASTSTKKLLNSLHLVSRGAIVWSTGDVVVSFGAAFVNRGTLQLLEQTDVRDGFSLDLVPPRIRGPRKGEEVGLSGTFSSATVEAFVDGASVVAVGGAGSAGGGQWAWEELSYDG